MARPKKVEEKQLAPAVPQPVPIAAPQQPQQQPQQPNLAGTNLQGRVIDVDNFIKVRNSVSATTPTNPHQPARCTDYNTPYPCPPPTTSITITNIHHHPLCPFSLPPRHQPALVPTPTTTALFHKRAGVVHHRACPACLLVLNPGSFRSTGISHRTPKNQTDKPSHQKCPSCTTFNPSPNTYAIPNAPQKSRPVSRDHKQSILGLRIHHHHHLIPWLHCLLQCVASCHWRASR